MIEISIVIPTIARPSLRELLASLEDAGARAKEVVIVDDRRELGDAVDASSTLTGIRVLRSGGRGPAAARNVGWHASSSPWIAFLDDDVIVSRSWWDDLLRDIELAPTIAGTQAKIHVPLPADRPPTDWERNVAGLATAAWITADMCYRRDALVRVGGFDERFHHAYREDADLALRVQNAGYGLARGNRRTIHPVRAADPWISLRLQRGNADDALMRALHGDAWRARAGANKGAFESHVRTVATALGAAFLAAAWVASTTHFAWKRIAPGPRTRDEVSAMLLTSACIPFAAVYHHFRGRMQS